MLVKVEKYAARCLESAFDLSNSRASYRIYLERLVAVGHNWNVKTVT